MKILVAIANYGTNNQVYLQRLINEYKSMNYDVDIVVFSNIPKDLDSDIEVVLGLPSKNPWSLPFAHKEIFAERVSDYDLFIYSEDDTLVKQRNIEAFLKVTKVLPKNEIAGFLRYEEDAEGKKYCSSIHSHFHWVSNSVKTVSQYTFAQFTNAHSACYILTRKQLQKAIKSGGYLVSPHEGRYDLLCAAATDPYAKCGFTKVICISHINDFLVHHLPNKYFGEMGLEASEMHAQINVLLAANGNKEAQVQLFPTRTTLNKSTWDKFYYEKCKYDVLALVPNHSKNVLSVGCGWGKTEAKLIQRGIRVVGIPLDPVIAESANSRGIKVLPVDFKKAKDTLINEKFDCILFADTLQHLPDPRKILTEFAELLDEEGCVIISVPNFKYIKYFFEILTNRKVYKDKKTFDKAHIHFTTRRMAAGWINESGLRIVEVKYNIRNRFRRLARASSGLLDAYLAYEILFMCKKVSGQFMQGQKIGKLPQKDAFCCSSKEGNRQGKRIKICLLGASFDTGNLGVSALAESSIKCILHCWPDAEVILLASGRKDGKQHLKLMERTISIALIPVRFCKNVLLPNHFCRLFLYALLFRIFRWKWLKQVIGRHNSYSKEIIETDIVADITGGDSFSDTYGMRRFVLSFLRKWLVLLFDKPLILLPQTYGPFKNPIARVMAKYVLKNSLAVYSRDRDSIDYLRKILNSQYVNEKVRFMPDVAFVLDTRRPEHLDIDSFAGRRTRDTVVVGLNVSGLLFNGGYSRDNMFSLTIDYSKLVDAIIDFFMAKKDVLIVLLPHVFPPIGFEVESDPEACLQVYKAASTKYKNRVLLAKGKYNHNEVKYVIGVFDFFVGSRMHSCIAAMSQCIPTVGIAYSKKFWGVFETVGMEQFVADLRRGTQEDVLATISKAFQERQVIAADLNSIVPNLKKTVLNMFKDISW